jgi:pimeloyl-ACP methyl ester carboxylesterase
VIVLNAGTTHRVGPNRLYVRIARELAGTGVLVLRFDLSGIGDSGIRHDGLPLHESVPLEIKEAMDCLEQRYGIEEFVLTGLCSGAAAAFAVARSDQRVVGALMINATAHFHVDHPELLESAYNRALARHAWRIALFSSYRSKNWRKVLTGQLNIRGVTSILFGGWAHLFPSRPQVASVPTGGGPNPRRDIEGLVKRGVRLLHVYAEGDEGLDYFRLMLGRDLKPLTRNGTLELRILKGVNHLFTQLWAQAALLELTRTFSCDIQSRTLDGSSQQMRTARSQQA